MLNTTFLSKATRENMDVNKGTITELRGYSRSFDFVRVFSYWTAEVYELANTEARSRMRTHGYVRKLKETAERLGANVPGYRLLDYTAKPFNPSGVWFSNKVRI